MMIRRRSNDPCWCGSGRKLKRCHGAFESARRKAVELGVVGPDRSIPDSILRPPYIATGGRPTSRAGVEIFDAASLPAMRRAGQVAAEVLLAAGAAIRPGVTTDEIDAVAHATYLAHGAYPSTVGYKGFRKSVCTSVNEVACHGIPDSRQLQQGDIVNVDVTAYIDGVHGDTSATFAVGELDAPTAALVQTTVEATLAGIAAVAPGRQLRAIGQAIEPLAADRGFGVISTYGGHGIGQAFHGFHVQHVDDKSATLEFVPGMTFTVEPMLTAGTTRLRQWDDGWTEVTTDGLPSAQFEHTVVVTDDGVEILTVTESGDTAVRWPN
jgi:methionyl aminopeptidase